MNALHALPTGSGKTAVLSLLSLISNAALSRVLLLCLYSLRSFAALLCGFAPVAMLFVGLPQPKLMHVVGLCGRIVECRM